MRIITNVWFEKQTDFELLFGVAQIIGATCGDNTFNNAIAKGAIPVYLGPYYKNRFADEVAEHVHKILKKQNPQDNTKWQEIIKNIMPISQYMGSFENSVTEQIKSSLTAIATNDNIKKLQKCIETIQTQHNFSNSMVEILQKIGLTLKPTVDPDKQRKPPII